MDFCDSEISVVLRDCLSLELTSKKSFSLGFSVNGDDFCLKNRLTNKKTKGIKGTTKKISAESLLDSTGKPYDMSEFISPAV